ncbi:DgyrCDS13755 [Dimorphilus gyrociliatus]|uniref:DgyrCDS13755 n=1 Tax=Dimorphilus gyrociliatus TaxID=2664684 RepID=A0A7I8WBN5_9ANNE|nr:DgyrCDS13755 [Dimorphilus gyrociliatus]
MDLLTIIGMFGFLYFSIRIYLIIISSKIKKINTKYVLITGCDGGFGKITAKRLHSKGVNVIAGCLTESGRDSLKQQGINSILLNITSEDSIDKAVKIVQEILPKGVGLWGLINNVEFLELALPNDWLSILDYQRTMNVNVFGLINVTLKFLQLIKKEQGRIVNMANLAGRMAFEHLGPYSTSKYAIEGFSDSLRREMKKWNVSVHTIESDVFNARVINVEESMTKRFHSLNDTIRNEYGEQYIKEYLTSYKISINLNTNKDVVPVIDAYVHAILSQYPKIRYTVGNKSILYRFVNSHLPDCVTDFILKKISKYPKPLRVQ